jgi:transposase
MEKLITYIGLDVHKNTIAVAVAESSLRKEVRDYGTISNTPAALKKLIAKLAGNGHELRFCYEAWPCGYGIQRQITSAGHECIVVAPSLIPKKPGDRVKTDRRDANNLAKLHRAGELTAVWVPHEAHEVFVIWFGRGWRRYAHCGRHASNCRGSCCAKAAITVRRRGRISTGVGWPG